MSSDNSAPSKKSLKKEEKKNKKSGSNVDENTLNTSLPLEIPRFFLSNTYNDLKVAISASFSGSSFLALKDTKKVENLAHSFPSLVIKDKIISGSNPASTYFYLLKNTEITSKELDFIIFEEKQKLQDNLPFVNENIKLIKESNILTSIYYPTLSSFFYTNEENKTKFADIDSFLVTFKDSTVLKTAQDLLTNVSFISKKDAPTSASPTSQEPPAVRPVLQNIDWDNLSIAKALKVIFEAAIIAAYPLSKELETVNSAGVKIPLSHPSISRCSNNLYGDYQCNNAMGISKALKIAGYKEGSLVPKDIAARIITAIPENPIIENLTTSPNGFINIHISAEFLKKKLNSYISNGITFNGAVQTNQKEILIDFSSPNIAKEMHVGHLRSTIIGDCLAKVFEFSGYHVHRVNHVGDWGTQFGMLISYLLEQFPDILQLFDPDTEEGRAAILKSCQENDKDLKQEAEEQKSFSDASEASAAPAATAVPSEFNLSKLNVSDLTKIYKESKKRFDEDPDFKERSRLNVVKLQSGDPVCLKIWKILCIFSRYEFNKVYNILNVKLEEYGESFYNSLIPDIIKKLEEQNFVSYDEGMKILKLPHFTIPLILQKSDGGYGYDSTDMTALYYRLFTLKVDQIIIITDAGQANHFHMCFDAGKAAGWLDEAKKNKNYQNGEDIKLNHIGFGLVCGDDGKRFKTRSSETVRLIDLLNQAKDSMKKILLERVNENKSSLSLKEINEASKKIGYGAIKYFDLKQNPTSNYIFSYEKMLDTRGDTAVYLLFAYARLSSILRKAREEKGIKIEDFSESNEDKPIKFIVTSDSERNLIFELGQFNDVIEEVLENLGPNKICDYLKEISIKFTDFVTKCHVLNAESTEIGYSRVLLCESARRVMEKCFYLLGIDPLEKI